MTLKIIAFCTVSTGLDAIAEVLRSGFKIETIVGVNPDTADPVAISGYIDISIFANKWGIGYEYVSRYDLKSDEDRAQLSMLSFDLIWVAGWQRLIPEWLIRQAALGAVGLHGSPDGIHGGRGRSPQNWAIMLGCKKFDLALFQLTSEIDDGSIILQKSFFYNETDDISTSYKKAALCSGEMMVEVLRNPSLLGQAKPQLEEAFYYPQRKPEDGFADWGLSCKEIWAHCRALTRPYPGLYTQTSDGQKLIIFQCIPFDDQVNRAPGTISFIFEDDSFLVSSKDGRLLVTDFSWCDDISNKPLRVDDRLNSQPFFTTMRQIVDRHQLRYTTLPVASRIKSWLTL